MDYGGVGKQLGQSEGVSQRGSVRGGQSEGGDGEACDWDFFIAKVTKVSHMNI